MGKTNILLSSTSKNPDDVVITLAVRTPLCKGKKGGFKDTSVEYLMYAILKAARERLGFSPDLVEDICMGNVCVNPPPFLLAFVRFCSRL